MIKRYIFGTREMHSYIYRSNSYPTEIISPISLIWHPADGVRDKRSIWLRCHPSAFKTVYESLNEAKIALSGDDLTISDLRGQVNTFEMYGPQSSQVLAGAFRLAKANGKAQRIAWQKIGKLTTPAHLPTGFVAGFNIDDPRLNYPPRNTKADKDKPVTNLTLSTTLAQSGIFSKAEREKVSKPRYKKAEIDSRRSKAQPGKPLAATPNDDVIPILVIQKKLEGGLRDSLDGYTLIVPAGWGMQIWSSLIHTDSRVGGIEQVEQFSVQVGASHFPESACPTSLANWEECQRRIEDVEERVSRKPKGKRPHYHSELPLLPFIQKPYQVEKKEDVQSGVKGGQLPTQPSEQAMDVHEDQVNTKQWFMTDELVRMVHNEIQENQKDVQDALKSVLTSLKCKDDVTLEDALVQATLVPIKRGYVSACGYVYDKDNDETCGRIATSTFAMNEGKAVAIANMQAVVYFKLYSQKKHLERIVKSPRIDTKINERIGHASEQPPQDSDCWSGVTAAAQIQNKFRDENKSLGAGDIAIVDASKEHHYQPGWTLIGSGLGKKEDFVRPESSIIPKDVAHIPAFVQSFSPASNTVTTATGETLTYDFLIVAAGLKINFAGIKGLEGALEDQGSGVSSIYNPDYAQKAWRDIEAFKSGKAIFTQPAGVIKCAGAPQKVMWMANSQWNRSGTRNDIDLTFATGTPAMFAVPKYSQALEKLRLERNVNGLFNSNLTEIDTANKIAKFAQPEGKTVEKEYNLLHVVPPQGPLDFYKNSPLADESGFVSVDKSTTQHTKYNNVFSIGDCSSLPNSKTAAAITAQSPVLVHNLRNEMEGKPLNAAYDGYASCPLLTGHGELLLAEFKYGGIPKETFAPILGSQDKPNRFYYHLKKDIFPPVYWNYFVKGNWFGTRGPIAPNFD
ncbi:POP1-domain-containing protein [Wallemia mellicola]|nr:POP1-domain-containing protein [Wallemia mellicola]